MPDANLRILYDVDTLDAATITGSSEADSDLADDNVVDDRIKQVWRTTGDSSENIVIDLGSATAITMFAVFGFNWTSAATITLEAHTSDSWGAPSYSQSLTIVTDSDGNVLPRIVFYLSETYRYWRLTMADAANPDTYLEIGRIMMGGYYEFTRNFNASYELTQSDPSEGDREPGRSPVMRARERFRQMALSFEHVGSTEADKVLAIHDKIGNSNPCVIGWDPTNRPSKDAMYCYLETDVKLVYDTESLKIHIPGLMFEEKTE